MRRFLVKHYDASNATFSVTSTALLDLAESLAKTDARFLYNFYLDDIVETVADYYTTPVTSFLRADSFLFATENGTYSFEITTASGSCDLYVNDVLIASSFNGVTGTGSVLIKPGVQEITFRYIGSGSYTIKWKTPSTSVFSHIPIENKPVLNYILCPFDIYDSVSETLAHDYKIIGELYQERFRYAPSKPYKKFQVTLKQDGVYDRLLVKGWFEGLKGKKNSFFLPSKVTDLKLLRNPEVGEAFIIVDKNFCLIAEEYVNRIIHVPGINFVSPILSAESYIENNIEYEKLFLGDTFTTPVKACDVQFIYCCRLDTDSITFELEDINFSSVRLSIIELYNDYVSLGIF